MFNTLTQNQNKIFANVHNLDKFTMSNNLDLTALNKALIDENGNIKCVSADELRSFGKEKLSLFAFRHGIYQFPTLELMKILRGLIGQKSCIEIGAGIGVIGRHLAIKMTDSYQQSDPQYRKIYENMGTPVIKYPKDVEKLSYKDALKKYRPDCVLGCWVTHRFDSKREKAGGNVVGVDASFQLTLL